jgi:AraC-like DNA-binding protein
MVISKLLIESSLILGIIVIILLIYYRKRSVNNSNLLLAISIGCIWYLLLINQLNVTREMLNYPVLARTGNIAGFLVMPFLYFYTRNSFYPGIRWRRRDWLFFLPALFYVVDLLPFFLSDNPYKIAVMKANLDNPSRMIRVEEGWIPLKGIHYILMYVWSLLLMVLQIRLIIRNKHIKSEGGNSMNRSLFWFIVTLTAFHLPLIFPGIFGVIFHTKWYSMSYLGVVLSTHLITSAVFILFSPRILYGFFPQLLIRENQESIPLATEMEEEPNASIPKISLSNTELQRIIEKMEIFMGQQKPFINKHYTIHNLGKDIEIPVYQLSPIINHHYKSNFNAWVNRYRVNYFIELCKNEKRKELTLAGIAEEAGFNNRSTFINAFKKETGSTPGNYLKQLEERA